MLPAPPSTNGQFTTPTKADSCMDLLSGDGFNSPSVNSLALDPAEEPQPKSPVTSQQQNALALFDNFPANDNHQSSNSTELSPHFQQQSNGLSLEPSSLSNGSVSGPMLPQYEQSFYSQDSASAWNGHTAQQQQPASPIYGILDLFFYR